MIEFPDQGKNIDTDIPHILLGSIINEHLFGFQLHEFDYLTDIFIP
jgi:hypothetical protein